MQTAKRSLIPLPIDPLVPKILNTLEHSVSAILHASPGSGKTTRVPPALLNASWLHQKEIWVLEPRRIAAKLASQRIAHELGESVGGTVGYQFRLENVTSRDTRIRFLTEGMFIRLLMNDPQLKRVGAIVLDEFHERHLQGDLALALVRQLQTHSRRDLRLLIMSATLDANELSQYLGQAPILHLNSPPHPLEIKYLARPELPLERQVFLGVQESLSTYPRGDLLVFLPGMTEMRRAAETLQSLHDSPGLSIHLLHGELSKKDQDEAIKPGSKRKVILATNIAESSVTIDGVNIVIDSGLHRQASHSPWTGLPTLKTKPISKASAIQRSGRAARQGPGLCVRLYSRGDFEARSAFDLPEIHRADLAQTTIELLNLGFHPLNSVHWFESPHLASVQAALELLKRLGALDTQDTLSITGKLMADLPVHPRLAKLLVEGSRTGHLTEATQLAVLLSEGKLDQLDALEQTERYWNGKFVDKRLEQLRDRWSSSLAKPLPASHSPNKLGLEKAVLSAFSDRIAQKRKSAPNLKNEIELLLSGGGHALAPYLPLTSQHQLFVVLDVQESQGFSQNRGMVRARSLMPIEEDWLIDLEIQGESGLHEFGSLQWNEQKGRVLKSERLMYGQLILSESFSSPTEAEREDSGALLLKQALGVDDRVDRYRWIDALARVTERDPIANSLGRIEFFFQNVLPNWKSLSSTDIDRHFARLVTSVAGQFESVSQLKDAPWSTLLSLAAQELVLLDTGENPLMDDWAPEELKLPGGRHRKVIYSLDQEPKIEAFIQDLYGVKDIPKIAKNRFAVSLHLLGPHKRPLQVTRDLASFWLKTYPEMHKELSRNYPKHFWPKDPLKAPPVLFKKALPAGYRE